MFLLKIQHWPDRAPDASKPYCLVDSNGTILGWYESRDAAEQAMNGPMKHSFFAPVRRFSEFGDWLDGNQRWVQFYPYGQWDHPVYGRTVINEEIARQLKASFDNRVKQERIFSNYEHGFSRAHGTKASGEIMQVEVRSDGLYGLVKFTDTAKQEIDSGEWNYWSTEHFDLWVNPQTHEKHNYVLEGGALTNSPYVGGMAPLNFSEVAAEELQLKQFAVWSTKYINDLPDSAFLYIQSGGSKDGEGKTTPRSLRHFPYKDSDGNIDLPHLRNAIARIPQAGSWLSDSLKSSLQARARKLLGAKTHSEVLEIEAEMAPQEHQEPGSGNIDPNINYDDSADTGSRIDTPPAGEDGSVPDRSGTVENSTEGGTMPEGDVGNQPTLDVQIRQLFNLADDADVLAHLTEVNNELAPLRELKKEHSQKKAFSEQYPDEYARMQRLEERDRENTVKMFSDALAERRFTKKEGTGDDVKDIPTTMGLSGLAIEEIGKVVKKFSDRSATVDDFKGALDAIFDNGLVDYGTTGSSRSDGSDNDDVTEIPEKRKDAVKMFSDRVNEIVKNDNLDFNAALVEAAKRYPDLAEAWRTPPVKAD